MRRFSSALLGVTALVSVASCGAAPQHIQAADTASASSAAPTVADLKPSPTGTPTRPTLPAAANDPIYQYVTAVNPGSQIGFADSKTGWKLSGQGTGPAYNIAAGPSGTSFAWPRSTLDVTTDGGATWSPTSLKDADGIWGFAIATDKVGYAVGIRDLWRTNDGGTTWAPAAEPAGGKGALVAIGFAADGVTGLGVTTNGDVYRTVDGARAWTKLALPHQATALCVSSTTTALAVEDNGDSVVTNDSGVSWRQVAASPLGSSTPAWSSASCNATSGVVSMSFLDRHIHQGNPQMALQGSLTAGGWSAIAANAADPALALPGAHVLDEFRAAASTPDGGSALIGFDANGSDLKVSKSTPSAKAAPAAHTLTTVEGPANAAGGTARYAFVQGLAFNGPDGWLLLEVGGLGLPDAPASRTVVLRSTDSGATWAPVYKSALKASN